jgi:alpha-beta hydrolase superfamily lysophospholipase
MMICCVGRLSAVAIVVLTVALPSSAAETPRPALPELRVVEVPKELKGHFDGDRISYMEAGAANAPTVLLLHGIGANSFYWRYLYEGLSARYRVVAWNAPGYILSDPLKNERPTCDDYAKALDAFAQAVDLPQRFLWSAIRWAPL